MTEPNAVDSETCCAGSAISKDRFMLKPTNQNAKYCYERVFECSRLQQVGAVPNSRIGRFCSAIEKCLYNAAASPNHEIASLWHSVAKSYWVLLKLELLEREGGTREWNVLAARQPKDK